MLNESKECALCGKVVEAEKISLFAAAGEWLSEDVWKDSGELCNLCLENRGRLAMMYLHDRNR
jgi:hypothetical protein